MSKEQCILVQDLLPLYLERLTSSETSEMLRTHLGACLECAKLAAVLQDTPPLAEAKEAPDIPGKAARRVAKRLVTLAMILFILGYLAAGVNLSWKELSVTRQGALEVAASFQGLGGLKPQILYRHRIAWDKEFVIVQIGPHFGVARLSRQLGILWDGQLSTSVLKIGSPWTRAMLTTMVGDENHWLLAFMLADPQIRYIAWGGEGWPYEIPETLAEIQAKPEIYSWQEIEKGMVIFTGIGHELFPDGGRGLAYWAYDNEGKLIALGGPFLGPARYYKPQGEEVEE